jgi:thiamine pyrophosphate-dependent acetolactate synthase large subunit-like protein
LASGIDETKPGDKVAVLSNDPLRSDLPYWGYPVNQILTGEIESSMKYLVESVKKRISKGNGDAVQRAESWRSRFEKRKAAWKDEAVARKDQKPSIRAGSPMSSPRSFHLTPWW